MRKEKISILFIDDNEDDYTIINKLLSSVKQRKYELHWAATTDAVFQKVKKRAFHVCLLDYRLCENNDFEIINKIWKSNSGIPVIVLTGCEDYDFNMKAIKMGASDYLEKGSLNSMVLERSIRYVVDSSRALSSLRKYEQQLRRLSSRLLEAQEDERKMLARELHDSLGSGLTAIRFALEQNLIAAKAGKEPPQEISLEHIIEMVKDTLRESQRITSNLRPTVLDDLGLIPALRSLGREFMQIGNDIHVDTFLEIEECDIPEQIKIVIYRIAQEALNNTSKHSHAGKVLLTLRKGACGIELVIKDNGCGFDSKPEVLHQSVSGMGIIGMKERADLSNGKLEISSEKGKGTAIRAYWPL
ncbi:MAG: response regulator [Syntrophales bacterium]|nr:response regulator [Syntrophales bacterium]